MKEAEAKPLPVGEGWRIGVTQRNEFMSGCYANRESEGFHSEFRAADKSRMAGCERGLR